MRSDSRSSRNGVRRRTTAAPAAELVPVNSELLTIPRLGQVRAEALAAAGVTSLSDLRKMSLEELARIKWIGQGNARLIKQWLDSQENGGEAPAGVDSEAKPAIRRSPRSQTPRAQKPARTKAAPAAKNSTAAAEPGELEPFATSEAEPAIKVDTLTDDVVRVDSAVSRIKEAIPKKSREKKLGRQLKKVAQSVHDLPQSADVLLANDKEAASEALDRIANLLNKAVETGKLSAKKQEAMGAELKKFRKRLEKALGG